MDVSGVTKTGSNKIDIDMDMDNEIEIDDDPILGNNEENEPKKKRSKAKNSSFVWDHFTKKAKPKVLPTNYKEKATCNYCGTVFTCNSNNNGTSSMRTHLVKRCKEYDLSEWEVESKVAEIKEGMKKVYNWYEKRTIENEERNVDESRIKEKNATRVMDLSEVLDSEFDQHMEEETNMVSKSELERDQLDEIEELESVVMEAFEDSCVTEL
ncbi:hypothetical protein Vadar_030962 [Vaccinium darrowii]|uniref:Uncharacterized protein n=1 Tax=Vaccinium darrowii TaxID=229202 RepID=A0ACB7Z1E6_9ERIC|nr:hypothetical protein Vadar_030962 [Vaccinium darrowii]